jgi:hypothetical protein
MTDGWIYAGRVGNEEMALVDVVSGAEYVPTYEDKDGDWMLVGDVPWRSVSFHSGAFLAIITSATTKIKITSFTFI